MSFTYKTKPSSSGLVYKAAYDENWENDVMHWRTKGSKNGVRLWQNPDGSYTEAGRNSKPGGRYNTRFAYGKGKYNQAKSNQGTLRQLYVSPKEYQYSVEDLAKYKMSLKDYRKVVAQGLGTIVLTTGAVALAGYALYRSPEVIAAIQPYINKDAAAAVKTSTDWAAANADALDELERTKQAYETSRAAARAAGGQAEVMRQASEDADRIIDMQMQMDRAADFARNPGAYAKKEVPIEDLTAPWQDDVDEIMSAIETATPQQRAAAADTLADLEKKMGGVNVSPAANLGVRREDYDSWDDYWKAYQKASDAATDRYYSGLRTAEQALKNTSGDEAAKIDAALDALFDMLEG